ncbi:hypothetical protein E5K00_02905 [Hymenobacter aquaticus]|uniref:Uncharacterized protein n=1 Tax=Hymenobacter aquaticus TaxID=1867101 RepID=A0A4Z0Q3W2_9BACT|nr:hypothetical protein [Hymenobacter aquaticus]TGE24179.1 hypothetical protein E5K00_02905 [Hymenobacter aquaticus]
MLAETTIALQKQSFRLVFINDARDGLVFKNEAWLFIKEVSFQGDMVFFSIPKKPLNLILIKNDAQKELQFLQSRAQFLLDK